MTAVGGTGAASVAGALNAMADEGVAKGRIRKGATKISSALVLTELNSALIAEKGKFPPKAQAGRSASAKALWLQLD